MTYNLNDGDGRQAVHQNDLLNRWQFSVKSGCAVSINTGTLGAADTLTVASGAVIHAGTGVSVSSQSVQIDAADASLPRKDLVYIDTNGDAQVAKGTPEAKRPTDPNFTGVDTYRPAPPDLSATAAVVLAEVWVAAGASSVDSGDLTNRRVDADLALRDLDAEQLSGDGVADGNTITDLVGQGLEVASGALRVLTSIYDGTNIVAPVDNASVATDELSITDQAARVYATSSQTVTTGTIETLEVDTDDSAYTSGDVLTVDLANNKITVKKAGTYLITARIQFSSLPDGTRARGAVLSGGTTEDVDERNAAGASALVGVKASAVTAITSPPTDITGTVLQDSGSDETTQGSEATDHLEVARLG